MKNIYKGLAAVILVMIAVLLFIGPLLKYVIVKSIYESTHGLYSAQLDKVSFDVSSFTYSVSDFELNFDKQKALDSEPSFLIHAKCPQLSMSGLSLIGTFFTNRFDIGTLNSNDTIIVNIFLNRNDSTAKKTAKKKPLIPHFRIGKIDIPFIILSTSNLKTNKLIWKSRNLSLQGEDFAVDLAGSSILGGLNLEMSESHFANEKQERVIKNISVNYSDNLFSIALDSLESHEIVKEFESQIDSISPYDYHFQVQKLVVKIDDLLLGLSALFSGSKSDFIVQQIELIKPVIFIQKENEIRSKNKKVKRVLANRSLQLVVLNELLITNGDIIYNGIDGKSVFEVKKFNCVLSQLQLDTANTQFPFKFYNISLDASSVKMAMGKNYQLALNDLEYNKIKKNLTIKELTINPLLKFKQFFINEKYQLPYVRLTKAAVSISQVDFKGLEEGVSCRSINVQHPYFEALKDKSYPWNENKNELLFLELIKGLPIPVNVDSLIVKNGTIAYREVAAKGPFAEITLDQVQLNVLNIHSPLDMDQSKMKIMFKSKLYKKIDLAATIMYINYDSGLHTITGKLGEGDFTLLNKFLEVGYGIKITTGTLKRCDFELKLNNTTAIGWVKPIYSDLSIDFSGFLPNAAFSKKNNTLIRTLSSKEKDKTLKTKMLKSFVDNVIYENNNDDVNVRKGIVNFSRKKYKPFLNFWIVSPIHGLLDAVTPLKMQFK